MMTLTLDILDWGEAPYEAFINDGPLGPLDDMQDFIVCGSRMDIFLPNLDPEIADRVVEIVKNWLSEHYLEPNCTIGV